MTLKEMRDKLNALSGEFKALDSAVKTEARTYTAEETTRVEAITAEAEQIKAAIKTEEDRQQAAAQAAARASSMFTTQPGTRHDSALFEPSQPAARIEVGKADWERDPKFGFKDSRALLKATMIATRQGWHNAKPNLKALFAIVPESGKVMATAGSDEQGMYSDPYGGVFIPESMLPGVLGLGAESDPIVGMLRNIPMDSPIVSLNARVDKSHSTSVSGGLRVYRRAEADTVTASRMQFEQVKLIATSLTGIAYATDELLAASPSSFVQIVTDGFNEEFPSKIMDEFISGTGVGQLEGILYSPAKIAITKETAQGSTFVNENAIKMMARLWRPYKGSPAVWLMNQTVLPQLPLFNVAVGGLNSQAVFVNDASKAMPMTLYGIPIVLMEECSALGTEGDVILCKPFEYLHGIYKPVEAASSIHVRFVYSETAFRFTMSNAGACWWRSSLTPKNGDTLSPIVTLSRS